MNLISKSPTYASCIPNALNPLLFFPSQPCQSLRGQPYITRMTVASLQVYLEYLGTDLKT